MVERLAIVGILAVGLIGVWGAQAWWVHRYRRRPAVDLLPSEPPGHSRRPQLVLAFSTPECALCQTVQTPALEELRRQCPDALEVRHVDATVAPDLAKRFGIFTVPSTVVIDEDGRILAINHGLSGWEKLMRQLRRNGDHPEPVRESGAIRD